MNHVKSVRFSLNPTTPCSLTVPQPFYSKSPEIHQFANTQSESREINELRTNFN